MTTETSDIPPNLEWIPADSSAITHTAYDWDTETAYLRFTRGAVYEYHGVDALTWQAFVNSDSLGASTRRLSESATHTNKLCDFMDIPEPPSPDPCNGHPKCPGGCSDPHCGPAPEFKWQVPDTPKRGFTARVRISRDEGVLLLIALAMLDTESQKHNMDEVRDTSRTLALKVTDAMTRILRKEENQ